MPRDAGVDGSPDGEDAARPPVDGPVLLFDGACNPCTGVVRFVIERDPAGTISFASLQSAAGRRLLERVGRDPGALDPVVLVEDGAAYARSDAAIRVARHLGGVYRLAVVGRLLPRPLRDAVYDFVADNRYDWSGRREQCTVPAPELRDRFPEPVTRRNGNRGGEPRGLDGPGARGSWIGRRSVRRRGPDQSPGLLPRW